MIPIIPERIEERIEIYVLVRKSILIDNNVLCTEATEPIINDKERTLKRVCNKG